MPDDAGRDRPADDGVQVRLCVIHPGNDWILSRLAREMVAVRAEANAENRWMGLSLTDWLTGPGPEIAIPEISAVYFVDAQCCWTPMVEAQARLKLPGVPMVGFYTHADRDDLSTVRPEIRRFDGIVHMCRRYYDRFLQADWYPRERMAVIPPGQVTDSFPLKPLRLGVCQRGGFPGKGDPFLFETMAKLPAGIRRHVELHIKGSGWRPSVVQWLPALGPMKVILDENEDGVDYPMFYRAIDYLLVPSLYEGGPMAVGESLSCGVPIISADVGFVPDLLVQWDSGSRILPPGCSVFPPGNHEALGAIVESKVLDKINLRERVSELSWVRYCELLEKFICRLRLLN